MHLMGRTEGKVRTPFDPGRSSSRLFLICLRRHCDRRLRFTPFEAIDASDCASSVAGHGRQSPGWTTRLAPEDVARLGEASRARSCPRGQHRRDPKARAVNLRGSELDYEGRLPQHTKHSLLAPRSHDRYRYRCRHRWPEIRPVGYERFMPDEHGTCQLTIAF
jgi:hypothetical protein